MAILTKRLRGSSLIEVVAAMVILMIVFGIGMRILLNVFGADQRYTASNALTIMTNLKERAMYGRICTDTVIHIEPFILERKCKTHPRYMGLVEVDISIKTPADKVLFQEVFVMRSEKIP